MSVDVTMRSFGSPEGVPLPQIRISGADSYFRLSYFSKLTIGVDDRKCKVIIKSQGGPDFVSWKGMWNAAGM